MSNSDAELSEQIYRNLHILAKWRKPSAEFLQIFTKDMFIKPNPKAFLHVTHFLISILDGKEFKKRFYWPVYDKNAESRFRTLTTNYLNELKEKYNLDFEPVKTHIVLFPGGVKFMKVYFELSTLVMKEELNKMPGGSACLQRIIIYEELSAKLFEMQEFVAKQLIYKESLNKSAANIKRAILCLSTEINRLIENSLNGTDLSTFVKTWSDRMDLIITHEIQPGLCNIKTLSKSLYEMDHMSDSLLKSKNSKMIECDENSMINCLSKLHLESQYHLISDVQENGQIIFSNLFNLYEEALPPMLEIVFNYRFPSKINLDYESEILTTLYAKAQNLDKKFHRLEFLVQFDSFSMPNDHNSQQINILNDVLMSTPTIAASSSSTDSKKKQILMQRIGSIGLNRKFPHPINYHDITSAKVNLDKVSIHDVPLKIPQGNDILKLIRSAKKGKNSSHRLNMSHTLISNNSTTLNNLSTVVDPKEFNTSTPLMELLPLPENGQLMDFNSSFTKTMNYDEHFLTPIRGSAENYSHLSSPKKLHDSLSQEISPSGRVNHLLKLRRLLKDNKLCPKGCQTTPKSTRQDKPDHMNHILMNNQPFVEMSNKLNKDLILDTSDTILLDTF